MAILAWLSVACAVILALALGTALSTMLVLLWKIRIALRAVHESRRRIAAHTAPLDEQMRAVADAMRSAAASLAGAAAAIRQAQSAVRKVR